MFMALTFPASNIGFHTSRPSSGAFFIENSTCGERSICDAHDGPSSSSSSTCCRLCLSPSSLPIELHADAERLESSSASSSYCACESGASPLMARLAFSRCQSSLKWFRWRSAVSNFAWHARHVRPSPWTGTPRSSSDRSSSRRSADSVKGSPPPIRCKFRTRFHQNTNSGHTNVEGNRPRQRRVQRPEAHAPLPNRL